MPRATVTSRVLKNQATGLDIQVPSFSVSKGLITSTVTYQVVLVSSLACFKAPSHKDSDVVQYSVDKKMAEFETMRTEVQEAFLGTVLPPIPKRHLLMDDSGNKERRAGLENLMTFLASTPKLATSVPVLTFLGVESLRAKKFSKEEPATPTTTATSQPPDACEEDQGLDEDGQPHRREAAVVFGAEDEDSGNEDMFGDDGTWDPATDAMFGGTGGHMTQGGSLKIFEGQDLKPDLTEEDERELSFLPDAVVTRKEVVRQPLTNEDGGSEEEEQDEEDNSDLLHIEDDLDRLMQVKADPKQATTSDPATLSSPGVGDRIPPDSDSHKAFKPKLPAKPRPLVSDLPGAKPSIPSKPKPSVPSKPACPAPPTRQSTGSEPSQHATGGGIDNLVQDDILKYLAENQESAAEEVSLFS